MTPNILKLWKYSPVDKPMYQGKFCRIPFDTLTIDEEGDVQLCNCAQYMPYTIGNIYQQSLQEIWHSDEANKVRTSVVEGKFTYCNWPCTQLQSLPTMPSNYTPDAGNFPSTIYVTMDRSCNLKCPSCRESVIIEKQSDKIQKQIEVFDEIRTWAASNPRSLINVIPVTGGEVFASHSALEFLKSLTTQPLNNLRLQLTTNGTLIKKNKQLVTALKKYIAHWTISVDAATSETYARVRGGNWDDLIDGLDIIDEFNTRPLFRFCIQQDNFHEIEQFADIAISYNGKIHFQKLQDWGHWTIQWWQEHNAFNKNKPSFDQALDSLERVQNKYPGKIILDNDIVKYMDRRISP